MRFTTSYNRANNELNSKRPTVYCKQSIPMRQKNENKGVVTIIDPEYETDTNHYGSVLMES